MATPITHSYSHIVFCLQNKATASMYKICKTKPRICKTKLQNKAAKQTHESAKQIHGLAAAHVQNVEVEWDQFGAHLQHGGKHFTLALHHFLLFFHFSKETNISFFHFLKRN